MVLPTNVVVRCHTNPLQADGLRAFNYVLLLPFFISFVATALGFYKIVN